MGICLVMIALAISGCGPQPETSNLRYEMTGPLNDRIARAVKQLPELSSIATVLTRVEMIEESVGIPGTGLGPTDLVWFYRIEAPTAAVSTWSAGLTPSSGGSTRASPTNARDWWPDRAAMNGLDFFALPPADANGWIGIAPKGNVIFIHRFTR